jgi:hypothetical protein
MSTATHPSFNPLLAFLEISMTNTNFAVPADNAIQTAAVTFAQNNTASAPVVQSKIAAAVQLMRQRIEALSIEREVWETTAYTRSNDMLYGLIQKSYELYIDLTNGMGDAADKKVGFKDYINSKGYSFKESTPLTGKIIRCVFGDKDRRRLSTYHTVLRVIVANKWAVADVPSKIAEFGGVQEISMGKPLGHLTPKEKAQQARTTVLATALATLSSDKLAQQNNPEKIGEQAVAVVTQNSDGTYTVHCVVHGDGLVNAALAGYFGANKEMLLQQQAQQRVAQVVATQDQQIANAADAANASTAVMTA